MSVRSLIAISVVAFTFRLFAAEARFHPCIQPLLRKRCHGCHGVATQMSGLRLDDKASALKGGASGIVIVPGQSGKSRLIRLVAGLKDKKVMPPGGPRLSPQEIGLLRAWVDQGRVVPMRPQKTRPHMRRNLGLHIGRFNRWPGRSRPGRETGPGRATR